jgi:hypothetical protein
MTIKNVAKSIPVLILCLLVGTAMEARGEAVSYNVKDYGATGVRGQDALGAIQKAIDACAKAGGGTVDFPPGDYTTGGIQLRSHVRIYLEPGTTVWASKDTHAYAQTDPSHGGALFYGKDLENVTLEGRGTVDGQAEYDWRLGKVNDDFYIRPNALLAIAIGKPLMRTFPKHTYPRLVVLLNCKNVRIAGLSFLHSGSFNIMPYACEHMVIDGILIRDSMTEGVWADGIDPNGCKDLHISNSTIETGDDALVFYSDDSWGPALPCENITVTNCRLSSASSALKFCDGNLVAIRKVTITNCVITNSNRGIAFMDFNVGYVSDVLISNVTIECNHKDWFWWGEGDPIHFDLKRRGEINGKPDMSVPPGSMRNIVLQNIIARGPGTSLIHGLPDSMLQGITLDNVKLFITADPKSPYEKTTDAVQIQWVKDLTLRNFEVIWDTPQSTKWTTAIHLDHVQNIDFDNVKVRQSPLSPNSPALLFEHADGVFIRNSRSKEGTSTFAELRGPDNRNFEFFGDDLRAAQEPFQALQGASTDQVKSFFTLTNKSH